MSLNQTQLGILKQIDDNKITLDEAGTWLRDQLVELVFHEPMLIDVQGPAVFLTEAGRNALTTIEPAAP